MFFFDVRANFSSADLLPDGLVCFNVGGHKYRVSVEIFYNEDGAADVLIREVLTHREYDKRDEKRK